MDTVKNIYQTYKQRLVSLDSRNKSFFLSVLYPKNHLDLVTMSSLLQFDGDLTKSILYNYDISYQSQTYPLQEITKIFETESSNPYSEIKKSLQCIKDNDIKKWIDLKAKGSYSEIKEFLANIIAKLDTEQKSLLDQFKSLERSVQSDNRDHGKDDLYLGYPFIEGKFPGGKYFRAPLVLHKIKLTEANAKHKITFVKDGKMINPVFVLAYLSFNEQDAKLLDFKIQDDNDDTDEITILDDAFKLLDGLGIKYTKPQTSALLPIKSITKKDFESIEEINLQPVNHFVIKNNVVIGMFPVSDLALYKDLDYLEKNPDKASPLLKDFFNSTKTFNEGEKDYAPKEKEILYVSPLDWSQRVVIKDALSNNLVIEGPPGTGKSQTIVNIIINLINSNKRVLFVSQKLAALEVVYNRLGNLRENALLIKDHIHNRDDFYAQLKATTNNLDYLADENNIQQANQTIGQYFDIRDKILQEKYFKNYSFESVVKFINNKPNVQLNEKAIKTIQEFNSFVEKDKLDSEIILNNLFSIEMEEKLNEYLKLKTLDLYKYVDLKTISFLSKQKIDNNAKDLLKLNFFLHKTNQPIIQTEKITNTEKLKKYISSPKTMTYNDFLVYAKQLYNKIQQSSNHLKTLTSDLYDEINENLSLLNLTKNDWTKINGK
ncbi:AAA domain-containing protein [[Mycoplasma] testudinis]|uniref:AAA domain-containing protein n=1 Tax=[Mycoplasma] testudinis TaxID=33924 RepID=UPI0004896596|nr:AAA domain-containing protein [[Mycoplasma] testudinis]